MPCLITESLRCAAAPRASTLFVLTLLALGASPTLAANDKDGPAVLPDVEANRAWTDADRRGEISFDPASGGKPALVINKAACRTAELRLDVTTDTNRIEIRSGLHRFTLQLQPTKTYRLGFIASDDVKSIELANRPLKSNLADWARLVGSDNPTFTVEFIDAKEANVVIRPYDRSAVIRARSAEAAPDPTPSDPAATPSEPAAPREIDPVAMRTYRSAVMRVRVETATPGVSLTAPAVLVSETGHLVTALAPLRGASGAMLHVNAQGAPLSLKLQAVDVKHGLALVKVEQPTALRVSGAMPLALAENPPGAGEPLWALPPLADAEAQPRNGKLVDIWAYERLPREARGSLSSADESAWIGVDTRFDADVSGCPVVNADGRVVGLSAWTWREAHTARFGPSRSDDEPPVGYTLAAPHLAKLLELTDAEPYTFERLNDALRDTRVPPIVYPVLVSEGKTPGTDLQRAVNVLRAAAICQLCKGVGKIDDEARLCPRCHGAGFNDAGSVYRLFATVVEQIGTHDAADPRRDVVVEHVRRTLHDIVHVEPKRYVAVLNAGTAEAQRTQSFVPPGTPAVYIARPEGDIRITSTTRRLAIVTVPAPRMIVVIDEPRIRDEPIDSVALAGGLLAGYVYDPRGNAVPVLQHGLLLDVPLGRDRHRP